MKLLRDNYLLGYLRRGGIRTHGYVSYIDKIRSVSNLSQEFNHRIMRCYLQGSKEDANRRSSHPLGSKKDRLKTELTLTFLN